MSIFDQAWVLTDVASDWLFPQSPLIVAEEKAMKDEEEHEDEGIMIDEPLTFDHLSFKVWLVSYLDKSRIAFSTRFLYSLSYDGQARFTDSRLKMVSF